MNVVMSPQCIGRVKQLGFVENNLVDYIEVRHVHPSAQLCNENHKGRLVFLKPSENR